MFNNYSIKKNSIRFTIDFIGFQFYV